LLQPKNLSSTKLTKRQGGTIDEAALKRGGRAAEVARDNGLPCITLVESGGANLTEQFKVCVFVVFAIHNMNMGVVDILYICVLGVSFRRWLVLQHHTSIGGARSAN
jgi:acetyl-CoA carboxylase carboxyltransferase component